MLVKYAKLDQYHTYRQIIKFEKKVSCSFSSCRSESKTFRICENFVSIYLYIAYFSDVICWVFAITNKYKQGRKAFEGIDFIENIAETETMTMVQEQ